MIVSRRTRLHRRRRRWILRGSAASAFARASIGEGGIAAGKAAPNTTDSRPGSIRDGNAVDCFGNSGEGAARLSCTGATTGARRVSKYRIGPAIHGDRNLGCRPVTLTGKKNSQTSFPAPAPALPRSATNPSRSGESFADAPADFLRRRGKSASSAISAMPHGGARQPADLRGQLIKQFSRISHERLVAGEKARTAKTPYE